MANTRRSLCLREGNYQSHHHMRPAFVRVWWQFPPQRNRVAVFNARRTKKTLGFCSARPTIYCFDAPWPNLHHMGRGQRGIGRQYKKLSSQWIKRRTGNANFIVGYSERLNITNFIFWFRYRICHWAQMLANAKWYSKAKVIYLATILWRKLPVRMERYYDDSFSSAISWLFNRKLWSQQVNLRDCGTVGID